LSDAIKDLAGLARESELLGISRPKTDHAPASLGEVIKIVLQRKTAARQKLIPAEGSPGSGVTDPQIQQATDDLHQIKGRARRLGVSLP
jgi:hypothetical protein